MKRKYDYENEDDFDSEFEEAEDDEDGFEEDYNDADDEQGEDYKCVRRVKII